MRPMACRERGPPTVAGVSSGIILGDSSGRVVLHIDGVMVSDRVSIDLGVL
jgi:hypothetical protein